MAEENRTENTEGQAQQAQDKNEPFFQLVRCYMKDASLEMPRSTAKTITAARRAAQC